MSDRVTAVDVAGDDVVVVAEAADKDEDDVLVVVTEVDVDDDEAAVVVIVPADVTVVVVVIAIVTDAFSHNRFPNPLFPASSLFAWTSSSSSRLF